MANPREFLGKGFDSARGQDPRHVCFRATTQCYHWSHSRRIGCDICGLNVPQFNSWETPEVRCNACTQLIRIIEDHLDVLGGLAFIYRVGKRHDPIQMDSFGTMVQGVEDFFEGKIHVKIRTTVKQKHGVFSYTYDLKIIPQGPLVKACRP